MMASSSITADRHRRRSSGQRIGPLPKELIGRMVEPIEKEYEKKNSGETDVEAPASNNSSQPQRRSTLLKPSHRRSSKFKKRETIVRLLVDGRQSDEDEDADEGKDNTNTTTSRQSRGNRRRDSLFHSVFSPSDWLMVSSHDTPVQTDLDIHREWERRKSLLIERPPPKYIILPQNKFRLAWDVILAIVLCVMAFYVPYRVCFYWNDDEEEESDETSPVFVFEMFIDSMFAVDIILNFFTAYTNSQSIVVSSPKLIALKYIKGFFLIDLLATIPFGYLLQHSSLAVASKLGKLGRLPKLIKFVRAARLLKLLRVYKLQKFIMQLEGQYNVHHGVSRLIKIVLTIMLVTHMVGCFWYLIGLSGGEDLIDGGWVYRYEMISHPTLVQYIASMYWAFSTLTTVGYGDIAARTPQEQCYAMVMMLVGVSWYAYIVSSMSSIMSSFDAQNKAVRDKMLCVNEFVRAAKLPKHLSKQVRDFFDFKLAKSQHSFLMSTNYDVDELLDELGSGLRADVLLYMDRHLISKIPFFENKVPQFVADTISMFQPMVFQEGDYICKEGTQADEMFFLVKGKAGIYYGEKLVVVIEEGSYFGEIGCIMGGIRRAGVKALTTCELQALSRRNLNTLLGEYPEVGDELKQVARDRASKAKHGTESTNVPDSSGPSKLNITAAPPTLIATPPPPAGINEDARYLALVDAEVSRIVSTLSAKIRADIGIAPRTSNVQREGITYESTKFIST